MQATTELKRLETIIHHDISFFVAMNCPVNLLLVDDFKHAMQEETERIKNNIIFSVVSVSRKAELKRYVQLHQQMLIRLASHLLRYSDPDKIVTESTSLEITSLCHCLYKSLEDLLNFVERQFSIYFNPDAWVPASYRQIALQEIGRDIEILKAALSTLGIDNKLIEIIFYPFTEFLDQLMPNEITYRKIKYLKTLKAELIRLGNSKEPVDDEGTRQLLIGLNFNSGAFFTYCTNFVSAEVNATETHPAKLEKLAFCLKEINQVRDRHGLIFDPRYRPLKEQIAHWIAEELNFREKTQQLNFGFPETDTSLPPGIRIDLDLSVAQTACLVHGFVVGGIIQNKNLSEMIRLLVSIIKTKRSETISSESFRMKYYNIEDSARTTIASRLRAIADYLLKN